MNPQEDHRRKYTQIQNYKTTTVTTAMHQNKEWKRSEVSREKEQKKALMDRPPIKLNSMLNQQSSKANPKTINFKNLKETVPKKQTTNVIPIQNHYMTSNNNQNNNGLANGIGNATTHGMANGNNNKNVIHGVVPLGHQIKPAMEYYGKNINLRSPPTQTHGISINVNIQNMIQQRDTRAQPRIEPRDNQSQMLSDRSGLGQEKKPKKIISNLSKIDDFECKQQLIYKRTPLQKQNKFPDKTLQKRPLISHKPQQFPPPQLPLPHTQVLPQPQKAAKQDQKQQKQILKKFELEIEQINSTAQTESINYLDHRQQSYLIPPYYIEKNQKNFTWKMRVTLFQWMMHVSYQFSLKRQTYYIAVNLVDLYLAKEMHVQRTDFQLAGTAAMFIASKLEEFEPKCSDQFAKATKKYSAAEVKQMQKRICKTLRYTLNPPTLSTWSNRLMLQWDTFLESNNYCQKHPLFATCQAKYFKKCDTESYRRYRTVMQLLDCATLDIQTVQYQPKLLVCAFMYLVLGHGMSIFKQEQIWKEFPRSSLYLLDEDNLFNDLFMNFLQTSFNIMLIDLLPTVQYCATYYGLTLNFQDPITPGGSDLQDIDFEDYCSFQTYNPCAKAYVFNTRFRGMYE